MAVTNIPCEQHYSSNPSKNRLSSRPLSKLIKSIFKLKRKKHIVTFNELHHLPDHLKADIGITDIRPPFNR